MIFHTSGDAYDRFMGRYSKRLAPLFADFARVEPGQRVLDVGAGPGALTEELVRRLGEQGVAAAEPSPEFVAALLSLLPGLDVRQAPAEDLPWPDASFDAALAQLVLTFVADPQGAAREMGRVVRPGGSVAACMWDLDGMELLTALRHARSAVDPQAASQEGGLRYRTENEFREWLTEAGFEDVETQLLEVEEEYADFEELWDAALGGVGPSGQWLLSVDARTRDAAREETFRQVGSPAGAFIVRGRAWAGRATRA